MIGLMRFQDIPDLISLSTHTDPLIRMLEYDSNCTSQTNSFDLAGSHFSPAKPEPLNAFESKEGLFHTEVDDLILPAYFWIQLDVPSPWNIYWIEAPYGGGLELDDEMFGRNWIKYWGAHAWFDCDPELPCECEGHNCLGTHSTEGCRPSAATTANSAPVPFIVIQNLTPTPFEIDAYNWHW